MDDEIEILEPPKAKKHGLLSFVVLAVATAADIAQDMADGLTTATTLLAQHYEHKQEEDEFYEAVIRFEED